MQTRELPSLLPTRCLLPTGPKSITYASVLMNVKIDSTVQDYKEENTFTAGRKPEWRLKVLFKRIFFFFSNFTMEFTGIKADTHLQ